MGLFGKILGALKKTKDNISVKLNALFSKNKIGEDFYEELEEILISADISFTTAMDIVEQIRAQYHNQQIYVTLEKKNARAVHLYEKFGFRDTGETDEGENVYVYERES